MLVTRRFDRVGAGSIHVEDFAQVLGRYPNEKYSVAENYETLARILNAISARSSDDALEFTRRLVVSILIGNSAFHLKNIALIYPDGRTPILAPAFDLTAAIQYASDDRLALAIAGERDVRHITEDTFIAYARLADLPPKAVIRCVRDTVRQAYASWPRILFAAPMDTDTKRRVLARLAQLPLASRH